MFTGIIKELGKVAGVERDGSSTMLSIECPKIAASKKIDDSVSVNGVCLTIISKDECTLNFQVIKESLDKSNLGSLNMDSRVNIEPALNLSQGIDGHIVQGHVDCTSKVKEHKNNELKILTPKGFDHYIAYKGSITINGVSLTVSRLEEDYFQVDLIDHTAENTNLGQLKPGDKVNIEIDIIARYLDRLLQNKEKEASYEFLRERNLI